MGCEKRSNSSTTVYCYFPGVCVCCVCVLPFRSQVDGVMMTIGHWIWHFCACTKASTHAPKTRRSRLEQTEKKNTKEKQIRWRGALLCFLLICQFLFVVDVNLVLLDFRFHVVDFAATAAIATVYHSIYRFERCATMTTNISFFIFFFGLFI